MTKIAKCGCSFENNANWLKQPCAEADKLLHNLPQIVGDYWTAKGYMDHIKEALGTIRKVSA